MAIGAYRHVVTLEHPSVVIDPPVWYCSLQSAATQVVDGVTPFFVRGRYHPGITIETQINFEGRTFQVQGVTDLDERHRELQLMCVEVVGRGTTPGGAPIAVPPTIATAPAGSTIASGGSVTLTVVAAGALPLMYQWLKAGAPIAGAVSDFYVTGPLTVTTSYAVTVSNAYGTVTSAPATVTVGAAQTYQQRIVADGAVAYWPLDDPSGAVARDLAGSRPATISGGVTLNQPGIGASKAMVFPSSGLGKVLPATFPSLSSAFTLEVWIQPLAPSAVVNRALMMRVINNNGDFQWYVPANTGNARFYYYSSGYTAYEKAVPLGIGVWTHLVLTGAGGQVTLYVNGIAQPSGAMTLSGAGTATCAIGATTEVGGETWGWRGAMQDAAVYARALTPAEIVAHYSLRIS